MLAATGLIVGESLFGVAYAGIVGGTGLDAPLDLFVGEDFETWASLIGMLAFAGAIAWLYRRTVRAVA